MARLWPWSRAGEPALDPRRGGRDRATREEPVGTDFLVVENRRAERFPEEFPEGPYGAPEASPEGGAADDAEEGAPPLFFFDGA
ncbi:MAG: hypothetical protein IRZ11_06800 [Clostridia bacterium]|nr:hypothetical protein [Clostridia bacterium]